MNYSFEFCTSSFKVSNEDDRIKFSYNYNEIESVYLDKNEIKSLIELLINAYDIMYSKKNNAE